MQTYRKLKLKFQRAGGVLTWYGPAKGITDRWARQFVEIANKKPDEVINDPTPYTLRPF
jgi:hypothetical protein